MSWGRRITLGLVVVLTLAALAAVVVGQLWLRGQRADEDLEEKVGTVADTAVTAVLSYDYRRLQAGFDQTLPLLTGSAKKQYDALQDPLLTTAPDLQAVVRSEVKVTTVLELDDDSAQVLLFVDQTSTSTKLAQPQLDQSRILVTVVRKDDGWLVETLKAV